MSPRALGLPRALSRGPSAHALLVASQVPLTSVRRGSADSDGGGSAPPPLPGIALQGGGVRQRSTRRLVSLDLQADQQGGQQGLAEGGVRAASTSASPPSRRDAASEAAPAQMEPTPRINAPALAPSKNATDVAGINEAAEGGDEDDAKTAADAASEAEEEKLEELAVAHPPLVRPWQGVQPLPGRHESAVAITSALGLSGGCLVCLPFVSRPSQFPAGWGFDALAHGSAELCNVVIDMVHHFDLDAALRLPMARLATFVSDVSQRYRDNPYHNFRHGVSVAHVSFLGLAHTAAAVTAFDSVDRLAVILAALCHDVDHPGVNNAFESSSLSEFAILYNDQSVLEHHHAALMFQLLQVGRGQRSLRTRAAPTTNHPRAYLQAGACKPRGSDLPPMSAVSGSSAAARSRSLHSPKEPQLSVLEMPRTEFLRFR